MRLWRIVIQSKFPSSIETPFLLLGVSLLFEHNQVIWIKIQSLVYL
ncbi:hypothetical protein POREN0001_1855 [Porphyromonas endodontalis ATCC 35406]|uniref:Uncharacterized protein n=1 Tax=Porphyromonas endodontalis (strain ATCC 35406 / DSM 24491 / JCM 8526 / CCUG 16442 / BCRC 14492 / NCTC 13058 / HG 370) TaxID=553175 RepID=C3JBW9_POREA|nr:hypothetical protein POREN0001_1855 [Porphyromonas endodontalis ATCC 35406]